MTSEVMAQTMLHPGGCGAKSCAQDAKERGARDRHLCEPHLGFSQPCHSRAVPVAVVKHSDRCSRESARNRLWRDTPGRQMPRCLSFAVGKYI